MTDKKVENFCIWAGPVALLLFGIGLVPLSHLVPPPFNPAAPIRQVVAFYTDHRLGILFGQIFVIWAAAFMAPFMLAIFVQIRRTEAGFPYLSSIFLFSAVVVVIEIILPTWSLSTAAFRVDRPPDITLALSDQAWLVLIWPNPQAIFTAAAVGVAILRDANPRPLFPRWLGFLNIAGGMLYAGSTFANMAFSGPFAWSGLMAFWIPAFDLCNWFVFMFFALRSAARRSDYEAGLVTA